MSQERMKDEERRDAVILGGGLIGLFSAYYLAKAGRKVTIVERERLGSGAARGNGGQVVYIDCAPLPAPGMVGEGLKLLFSPTSAFFVHPRALPGMAEFLLRFALNSTKRRFARALARMDVLNRQTRSLYQELVDDGLAQDLRDVPFLYTYSTREEAENALDHVRGLASRKLGPMPSELMDRESLLEYEPAIGSQPQWGFLQAGELSINPSLLVDELIVRIGKLRVEVIEGEEALSVEEYADGVRIETGIRTIEAEQVLVATGAWADSMLKRLKIHSIIKPGKGYSFTVDVPHAPRSVTMFGDAHVGAIPLSPTTVRVAGTMEFDGTIDGLNKERVEAIAQAAGPHLAGADWENRRDEWVGARPMTPDGLPHIGLVPGRRRIFVCAGHNMLGLSLGPASARVVTDHMQGTPHPDAVAAFDPGRFGLRRRRR